ncbi:MAG: putative rane protein, partial [candidate division NC10 bacterium]|nr:putative rane protein [candidate division NC10 bacterium]
MDAGVRGKRWLAGTAEAVLASVLAVGLFASGSFFPVLGIGLSLLCPLPLVAVGLRHGRTALLLALALATLMLIVPLSTLQGVVFLLEFGAPAVVLEAGLRRGARSEVVVIGVA